MVLVAHNAAFELSFLEHHGIAPAEMHCTMQACRLTLGEHQTSLADAARAYLDVELDKTSQISDWSAEHLTLAQIEYAARDAVVCWNIFNRVMPALGAQESAYEIQMTAIPAVVRMQLRGFRLDTDAHAKLIEDLRRRTIRRHGRVRQGVCRLRPCDLGCRVRPIDAEREDQRSSRRS